MRLPIIAMTANVLAEDRERCVAAGMNDFVAKPVDVNALTAAVRRWLPGLAASAAPPSGPVPVANDTRLAPLQGIHGLDLRDGLRRCGDKAELYLELLRRFVDGQPATLAELHQVGNGLRGGAGLEPDIEPLRLRVHSLKGVAGNLGATLLHSRCEALERRLREDPLAAGAAIGEVESTTRILGDALRAALGVAAPPSSSEPASGAIDALDLSPLLALLQEGDPDAMTWAEQRGSALHQQLGSDAALLLARIRQFDFDQALALLARHGSPKTP
jgi:two-component system sensor histidine kinase/response regulator